MKTVTNIELFNGVAGRLFAILYERFPFYTDVEASSLSSELVDKDDYDGAWDVSDLADATVKWLAAAGYIWLKEPEQFGDGYSAVLSPKGFEVLKATPKVIGEGKTLGEKIKELSKDKLNSGFTKLVEVAISEGFKLMLTGIRS
jgi:hypothetical protein